MFYIILELLLISHNFTTIKSHTWCNAQRTRLECGRSWVRARSGITKDYNIGICSFSAKQAALRIKSKDWLARNQDNIKSKDWLARNQDNIKSKDWLARNQDNIKSKDWLARNQDNIKSKDWLAQNQDNIKNKDWLARNQSGATCLLLGIRIMCPCCFSIKIQLSVFF